MQNETSSSLHAIKVSLVFSLMQMQASFHALTHISYLMKIIQGIQLNFKSKMLKQMQITHTCEKKIYFKEQNMAKWKIKDTK